LQGRLLACGWPGGGPCGGATFRPPSLLVFLRIATMDDGDGGGSNMDGGVTPRTGAVATAAAAGAATGGGAAKRSLAMKRVRSPQNHDFLESEMRKIMSSFQDAMAGCQDGRMNEQDGQGRTGWARHEGDVMC